MEDKINNYLNGNNIKKSRMVNKGLLFLMLFIFSFTFVVAEDYAKIGENNLQFSCTVNYQIPSAAATYNFSLYYPNGTSFLLNKQAQTQGQGSFNYTVDFPFNGDYILKSFCYDTAGNFSEPTVIHVTPTGRPLDLSQVVLFGFIFILVCVFLYGAIYGITNAANGPWQIAYICISYLLFFSIFFIGWLFASNYLWQTPIIESIFWIIWLILSIMFWPFIIYISIIILGKEAEQLLAEDYQKKGYSREDSLNLAKRKR